MLGIDDLRSSRVLRARRGDGIAPVDVATGLHRHLDVRIRKAAQDDHLLDRGGLQDSAVDGLLQWDDVSTPPRAVLGHDDLRPAVVDAVAERVGGKSAEYDAVRRSEPRAREHRDSDLGHHTHVDRDPVALPNAELLQRRGEGHDLFVELAVGDGA